MDDTHPLRRNRAALRSGRFPVDDGLGIYCWYCADLLKTGNVRDEGALAGWGRWAVRCGSCQMTTRFDREQDLEPGTQPE